MSALRREFSPPSALISRDLYGDSVVRRIKAGFQMGVVLRIGARKAFLRDGQWRCADSRLELRLNQETDRWISETGGPDLASPDPEADVAEAMARLCGGVIQMHVQAHSKRSTSLYFSRRQYSFDFSS
jgi:hypothetical protein